MYRVYDKEMKEWVNDKIYLTPKGELLKFNYSIFGWTKLPLALSEDRYVYHRDIGLHDKNEILVYEGDFIKAQVAEDRIVIGLVTYAREISAYIILCYGSNEYFTLGSEVCKYIEVIGNVFDGHEEDVQDGQSAL